MDAARVAIRPVDKRPVVLVHVVPGEVAQLGLAGIAELALGDVRTLDQLAERLVDLVFLDEAAPLGLGQHRIEESGHQQASRFIGRRERPLLW